MPTEPIMFYSRETKRDKSFRRQSVYNDCFTCVNRRFTDSGTQIKCKLKRKYYFDKPCKKYSIDR